MIQEWRLENQEYSEKSKFIGENNFKIFSGNTLQILWQEATLYSFNQWEERDESF